MHYTRDMIRDRCGVDDGCIIIVIIIIIIIIIIIVVVVSYHGSVDCILPRTSCALVIKIDLLACIT